MPRPLIPLISLAVLLALYVGSYALFLKPLTVAWRSSWYRMASYRVFKYRPGNASFVYRLYSPLQKLDERFIRPSYWHSPSAKTKDFEK